MKSRRLGLPLLGMLSITCAAPAMAHANHPTPHDPRPEWTGEPGPAAHHPGHDRAAYEQARADWLAECRANRSDGGKTVGGVVLGGLVGGVIGNRIAGRGNRTVGTVVGAVAGATAGGAIGNAADRREARDYCEAYLDRYTSHAPQGYYGHAQAVGWGYAPVMVMMPVAMVPITTLHQQQQRECTETVVTEEWVTVPGRPKPPYTPPRRAPDKRVRVN
jgi:hypothetical protein